MPRKQPDLITHLFSSIRAQAEKRKEADTSDKEAALLSAMLPHQRKLEADRSRHVSVISPRQTGKSTAVMLLVALRCFQKAGAEWVVVGLTRPSVKRIYWSPLKKLNEMMELGLRFQDQELVATFPNGSRIYFVGGETIAEIEKLRGGRYDGAIVDECKSYSAPVFQSMMDEILQPALNTKLGPLIIIGTPGDYLAGEFFLATCQPAEIIETPLGPRRTNRLCGSDQPPANWSLHVWTLQDNSAVPHLWTEALELKMRNGWADDHPVWMREYLGRWVATDHFLVYRYAPHRHDYVPSGKGRFGLSDEHEWRTVLGVDLGTRDGTALVVWAFSPTHPGLWEVYSEVRRTEKGQKFPLGSFVTWYREVENTYGPFEAQVVDPAGLATLLLDTLADEHQIYLEPADKREKNDHIELFNRDLDARLIRTLVGSDLTLELSTNRWDEKQLGKNKREEMRSTPNDTCDAGLYAFRWCNHRRAQEKPKATTLGSPAWWAAVQAAELEAAKKRARDRANTDSYARLDRDEWWNDAN